MTCFRVSKKTLNTFMVLLAAAGANSAQLAIAGEADTPIVYTSIDRLEKDEFSRGIWSESTIYPRVPMKLTSMPPYLESIARPAIDCSDRIYRCLRSHGLVFAVPRKGIRRHSEFTVLGANLKLEACYRAEGDRCQTALMSTSCRYVEWSNQDGFCRHARPEGDPEPEEFAYVWYFLYNEDAGITAYGGDRNIRTKPGTEKEMRDMAIWRVLIGDRGILAPLSQHATAAEPQDPAR